MSPQLGVQSINNSVGIQNEAHSNATINNNTISLGIVGIACSSSSPIITFNNITFNQWGGVCSNKFELPDIDWGPSDPELHWNNIHDNREWNLQNLNDSTTIDARWNYWDPTPPAGIDGLVDWTGYLTSPIEEAGPQ
ncbi:MAG: hypothetical protein JSW00_06000 [Thermoplasmata archaeon]|nr:MAG: hypothetical protein JSW00_06000 [Thermoplasmata archaeon]